MALALPVFRKRGKASATPPVAFASHPPPALVELRVSGNDPVPCADWRPSCSEFSRKVFFASAAAVALLLVWPVAAQFPEAKSEKPPAASADAEPSRASPAQSRSEETPQLTLPGFWALSMPPVQKALWLNEQQKTYLQRISDRFQAKAKEAMEALQRLPAEEQRRRLESFQDQARRDAASVRKQVAAVLTSQQLQAYEKLDFRLRVPAALGDPQLLRSLGLSEKQRSRLGQIRDNLEERLHEVQTEAADKTLEALTPEQQEKLKEELNKQRW